MVTTGYVKLQKRGFVRKVLMCKTIARKNVNYIKMIRSNQYRKFFFDKTVSFFHIKIIYITDTDT